MARGVPMGVAGSARMALRSLSLRRRWGSGSCDLHSLLEAVQGVLSATLRAVFGSLSTESGGVWRSWLTHVLWEHEIVGSNPTTPTTTLYPEIRIDSQSRDPRVRPSIVDRLEICPDPPTRSGLGDGG